MVVWIVFTLLAVAWLLVAEFQGARRTVWMAKPAASGGFLATSLAAGALDSAYGQSVLLALVLCWLGDLLLIPQARVAFLAGLTSFLFGHLAFALAFAQRGLSLGATALVLLAGLAPALGFLRWAGPHLPAQMVAPVRAYVAVITLMVACAAGTVWQAGRPAILLGALLFYLSDLAVARDRFIAPGPWNRLWGLPLYYAAQLVLASSVGLANP